MNNQENFQKGSYAIVPSFILDNENLDEGAKSLYARISMYSSEGRCWASNQHFADKQKVTIRCIQHWLKQLVDNGYIEIEIDKTGFQTKRNIWILIDFKNNYTKRNTVHPDMNYSSPPHEPQFTSNIRCINTSDININPPPLTPPKVEKITKEIPKEEEDFSFFKEHNFSESQVKRILKFSRKEIERAFLIFPTIKVKISEFGSFWDILKHPENYSDKPEKIEKLTPQKVLVLSHNEFLREFLPKEICDKNIDKIKNEGYLVIGRDNRGNWVTWSCKDTVSEKQLREDIKDDILLRKKR